MRIIALAAPLVSLLGVGPTAIATAMYSDRASLWTLAVPFILGVIAYPGYAAAVIRPRNTIWIRASLILGLTAAISGLILVLWGYRHLAGMRAFAVAVTESWYYAVPTLICPAVSIVACVIARRRLSPRA